MPNDYDFIGSRRRELYLKNRMHSSLDENTKLKDIIKKLVEGEELSPEERAVVDEIRGAPR